jgi:hypothetical protein
MMRKSTVLLIALGSGVGLLLLSFADAARQNREAQAALAKRRALVTALELTDLSLFTEARYTRHLTQADWSGAFQDHPAGLEHFPSGSLYAPPHALRQGR